MKSLPRVSAFCLAIGSIYLVAAAPGGTMVKQGDKTEAALEAQVRLDRAGFSPGVIDGQFGGMAVAALKAFQQSRGIEPSGTVDAATWEKLRIDDKPAVVRLAVSAGDAAGPFRPIPQDMMEKAKLTSLSYSSAIEGLAEKFHTTPAFIQKLNPGIGDLAPGTIVSVPNVRGVDSAPTDATTMKVPPAGPRLRRQRQGHRLFSGDDGVGEGSAAARQMDDKGRLSPAAVPL